MKGLEFVRKLYGRSLSDVASYLGVTNQAVSSWERKNSIPEKRLSDLSNYFDGLPEGYFDAELTPELQDKIELNKWSIESQAKYFSNFIDSFDSQPQMQFLFSSVRNYVIGDGDINTDRVHNLNRIFNILNNEDLCGILMMSLKAIEIVGDMTKKTDDQFVTNFAELLRIWKINRDNERNKIEQLKKQMPDYDDLY